MSDNALIAEFAGLEIDFSKKSSVKFRIDYAGTDPRLGLNTNGLTISVLNCTIGDKIAITLKAAGGDTDRGITLESGATFDAGHTGMTDKNTTITAVATVTDKVVTFKPTAGINIYSIETGTTLSVSSTDIENASVVKTEYFNIAGQPVANPSGIVICKETLSNGKVNVSKIVK